MLTTSTEVFTRVKTLSGKLGRRLDTALTSHTEGDDDALEIYLED